MSAYSGQLGMYGETDARHGSLPFPGLVQGLEARELNSICTRPCSTLNRRRFLFMSASAEARDVWETLHPRDSLTSLPRSLA